MLASLLDRRARGRICCAVPPTVPSHTRIRSFNIEEFGHMISDLVALHYYQYDPLNPVPFGGQTIQVRIINGSKVVLVLAEKQQASGTPLPPSLAPPSQPTSTPTPTLSPSLPHTQCYC